MLEVVVVLTVAGILTVAVAPSLSRFVDNTRLRSGTEVVRNQLMVAKMRAVANPDVHCGVHFDTTAGTSLVFHDSSSGSLNRYVAGEDRVYSPAKTLPDGTRFSVPGTGGITNLAVVFRGDGSAKFGGAIEIVSNRYTGRKRRIVVNAVVGKVKVVIP